jgi:hypothetical protein
MIVGNGNIAKCLSDRPGAIFFASGVSNSRLQAGSREYAREIRMLHMMRDSGLCLFYFSSVNAMLCNTPYMIHKYCMEDNVKDWFENYVILRIGNLIGDTNPNTFINYIKNRQAQGLSVEIKDEYRYMIDGATLNTLCQTLPLDQKLEITVATKIAKVKDLLL